MLIVVCNFFFLKHELLSWISENGYRQTARGVNIDTTVSKIQPFEKVKIYFGENNVITWSHNVITRLKAKWVKISKLPYTSCTYFILGRWLQILNRLQFIYLKICQESKQKRINVYSDKWKWYSSSFHVLISNDMKVKGSLILLILSEPERSEGACGNAAVSWLLNFFEQMFV